MIEDCENDYQIAIGDNNALSNRNLPVQPTEPYRSSNQLKESTPIPGFGKMSLCDPEIIRVLNHHSEANSLPLVIHKDVNFNPMSFHTTKGSNVRFTDHNRNIA